MASKSGNLEGPCAPEEVVSLSCFPLGGPSPKAFLGIQTLYPVGRCAVQVMALLSSFWLSLAALTGSLEASTQEEEERSHRVDWGRYDRRKTGQHQA